MLHKSTISGSHAAFTISVLPCAFTDAIIILPVAPTLFFLNSTRAPLRTPSHTHWIVDLIVKGEVHPLETLDLVKDLIQIYDNVSPFETKEERDSYELTYSLDLIEKYSGLNNTGSLSIELIGTLVELFSKCEKQTSGAFMFKSMLTLTQDYFEGKKDYYQVIGTSKRV